MGISLGSTPITKMYLGGTQLTAVYLGIQSLLASFPLPANINAILLGDSRTSFNGEDGNLNEPRRIGARGYGTWLQAALGYRINIVGNYGINTDTLDGLYTRRSAQGIATGSSPTWRAEYLTQAPGNTAAIAFVLIGVNDTNSPIGTTGPKYDTLFKALIDAGKIVVILNENPNSDQSGQGLVNFGRRQYLDTWPESSTGMTAPEKALYGAKVVRVNVYDALALTPTSYYPKTGYYPAGDILHIGPVGARAMAEAIATQIEPMLTAAGFPARNTLPSVAGDSILANPLLTGSTAITATNGESAGAGGANMDGNNLPCVTGVLPTGWAIGRSSALRTLLNAAQPVSGSQLSVVVSKTTDSNGFDAVRIRVTGQVGTTASTYGITFSRNAFVTSTTVTGASGGINGSGSSLSAGDAITSICRMNLAAAPKGLLGAAVEVNATSTNAVGSTRAAHSGTILTNGSQWDLMGAYDSAVMSPPHPISSAFVTDTGTLTLTQQLTLTLLGGVPIDVDIVVSRFAVVKNR